MGGGYTGKEKIYKLEDIYITFRNYCYSGVTRWQTGQCSCLTAPAFPGLILSSSFCLCGVSHVLSVWVSYGFFSFLTLPVCMYLSTPTVPGIVSESQMTLIFTACLIAGARCVCLIICTMLITSEQELSVCLFVRGNTHSDTFVFIKDTTIGWENFTQQIIIMVKVKELPKVSQGQHY